MASLRKGTGTQFWFACFTLAGGRRVQRSTGTSDRKLACQLAEQFELATSIHRTAKQAQRVMADLHRHITGQTVDRTSVRDFLTGWLSGKKGALSTSSYEAYEAVATSFVQFMGERADLEIAHVTATEVIKFRDFLATQVSVNSTNNRLKVLRVALQQAWRDGKLEENPGKKAKWPRPDCAPTAVGIVLPQPAAHHYFHDEEFRREPRLRSGIRGTRFQNRQPELHTYRSRFSPGSRRGMPDLL